MRLLLCQLQEKALEQHQRLYAVFVDFSKAFDSLDRNLLWKQLGLCECPGKLVGMIERIHGDMSLLLARQVKYMREEKRNL